MRRTDEAKNKKIGDAGENYAGSFLKNLGYEIIERNYKRLPFGEIDIVAIDKNEYVFCEVKTSIFQEKNQFYPEFRIQREKLRALARIIQIYSSEHMFQLKQKWRVDVISIFLDKDLKLKDINHIQNIYFN